MLRLLKKHVKRADGLEVNPEARGVAESAGCHVLAALDELPNKPTYNVVLSNHVLEHIRDVCAALENLRANLRPHGLFVTKLPIDDFRARHQRQWSECDIDNHLATWTPRLFANVLQESGFKVVTCEVITSAWHPRLFPIARTPVAPLALWACALALRRRQLFAVGMA
jgi:SAM-dependent methyltransferase